MTVNFQAPIVRTNAAYDCQCQIINKLSLSLSITHATTQAEV